jgi:hypothetical protein
MGFNKLGVGCCCGDQCPDTSNCPIAAAQGTSHSYDDDLWDEVSGDWTFDDVIESDDTDAIATYPWTDWDGISGTVKVSMASSHWEVMRFYIAYEGSETGLYFEFDYSSFPTRTVKLIDSTNGTLHTETLTLYPPITETIELAFCYDGTSKLWVDWDGRSWSPVNIGLYAETYTVDEFDKKIACENTTASATYHPEFEFSIGGMEGDCGTCFCELFMEGTECGCQVEFADVTEPSSPDGCGSCTDLNSDTYVCTSLYSGFCYFWKTPDLDVGATCESAEEIHVNVTVEESTYGFGNLSYKVSVSITGPGLASPTLYASGSAHIDRTCPGTGIINGDMLVAAGEITVPLTYTPGSVPGCGWSGADVLVTFT